MALVQIPELGDTIFVVLRKKPLIFLHWYHHVTVLLYCWHSYYEQTTYGLYFVSMNYTVHGKPDLLEARGGGDFVWNLRVFKVDDSPWSASPRSSLLWSRLN